MGWTAGPPDLRLIYLKNLPAFTPYLAGPEPPSPWLGYGVREGALAITNEKGEEKRRYGLPEGFAVLRMIPFEEGLLLIGADELLAINVERGMLEVLGPLSSFTSGRAENRSIEPSP